LIDFNALDRIAQWVEEAVRMGAHVLAGGRAEPPCYMPTVLTNVPNTARITCEEAFGPVVVVEAYDAFEEAIEKVNATPYGLHSSLFTQDLREAFLAAREIHAGGVLINDVPTFRSDLMPYGGMKESGLNREGIRWAMEHMTDQKTICFNGVKLG
jgi:acyl-CoA reductase-like NAD-dependent aldehyde dehydrogenase